MRMLRLIFLSSFFYSIHASLVAYLNSSMLDQYIDARMISVIFALGSALSLIVTLAAPRMIRSIGVVQFTATLLACSIGALVLLGTTSMVGIIIPVFIVYFSLNTAIFYCIDLFIEHYSSEGSTGNIRGLAMTINNIGWVSVPIITGSIVMKYGFDAVYLIAAASMSIVAFIIMSSQRSFKDRRYAHPGIRSAYALMRKTPLLRRIISINFLLQLFYSWMVLYVPLYLSQTLGFDWKTIGIIISIMLIPFVLLQYPTGRLADRIGEKKLLITSLCIGAVATLGFGLIHSNSVLLIAALLFGTRVGISMLEVLSDTYFFKQVSDKDTSMISLYRIMTPVAYIIGPMIGALLLFALSYQGLFVLLGILLFVGALYARRLVDTTQSL